MNKADDKELRSKVIDELDWDPSVDASAIGVSVHEGVVTLLGHVTSYPQKKNAERAAKRIAGVRAVAEDLEVRFTGTRARSDATIAATVVSNLRSNISIPHERIQVTVEQGWVTLDGEVPWQFQRTIAENAIRHTLGVKGITNRIAVKPATSAADVKAKIESAFARRAKAEADDIKVDYADGKVVLRGHVHSWKERDEAEQAAWSAPGVSRVDNEVVVSPM